MDELLDRSLLSPEISIPAYIALDTGKAPATWCEALVA
jgi:hypothetical protein